MIRNRLLAAVPGAATVLMALAVIDALRHPPARWRAAGHRRLPWLLGMVALPGVGPALYRRRVRPDLLAAA